jgi:hypothetical protein
VPTQLHGEAETVVIAAAAIDQRRVAVVEVKEPIQLRRRRRLAVATVARELTAGEEVDGHRGPQSGAARRALTTRRVAGPLRRPLSRPAPVAAGGGGTGWCAGSRSS